MNPGLAFLCWFFFVVFVGYLVAMIAQEQFRLGTRSTPVERKVELVKYWFFLTVWFLSTLILLIAALKETFYSS